jgi:anti-sigma B factor antagonist
MVMVPEDAYPVQWTGRQALIALPEHIDVSNAGSIREELLSVINRGAEALIVDMTATISCDQAGAKAVARAYQRAVVSGTELRLAVTSGAVLEMLGVSGVGHVVPVYPSVEAASVARSPAARARGIRRRRMSGASPGSGVLPRIDVGVEVALPGPPEPAAMMTPAVVRDMTEVRSLADADAAQRVHRSQELLDSIITRLYRVGVSLQAAAALPRDAAGPHLEEALRTLDDTIGQIRDSTFADQEEPGCQPGPSP